MAVYFYHSNLTENEKHLKTSKLAHKTNYIGTMAYKTKIVQ